MAKTYDTPADIESYLASKGYQKITQDMIIAEALRRQTDYNTDDVNTLDSFINTAKTLAADAMAEITTVSRMRVNRTDPLALTTSWQKVDFNGVNTTLNVNTYEPVNGKPSIGWDSTAKLFRVYGTKPYNLSCHFAVVAVCTGVGLRTNLRYRVVVPNGAGAGVDYYFPNPDVQANAWIDMGEVTTLLNTEIHLDKFVPVYVENTIRANGFYIQVSLSNALAVLATATITRCSFLIQSTGK